MRDRLRVAAAYAIVGVAFGILTLPSFEGVAFNSVRERTNLTFFTLLTLALAALCAAYGYVSQPQIGAVARDRRGRRIAVAVVLAMSVVGLPFVVAPVVGETARASFEQLIVAWFAVLFMYFAFAGTRSAARIATSDDTLVARADRRAVFRNAIAFSTVPFAARWPNRPFVWATFGRHWVVWFPVLAAVALTGLLALDVIDERHARRLLRAPPPEGSYREAETAGVVIGAPRSRLQWQLLHTFSALVIVLAVIMVHVTAHRWAIW